MDLGIYIERVRVHTTTYKQISDPICVLQMDCDASVRVHSIWLKACGYLRSYTCSKITRSLACAPDCLWRDSRASATLPGALAPVQEAAPCSRMAEPCQLVSTPSYLMMSIVRT